MPTPTPSLARGSATLFLSMSLAAVLAFLISIFVARWLGASDFGMYSILISVQGVVLLLASFSIGTAVAKYVAEYRVRDEGQALRFAKSGLVVVLMLSSLVAAVYVALSDVIGRGLYKEPALVRIIPFSALMVISTSTYSLSLGIVQGCQKFRLMAIAQVAYPLFSLVLIFLLLPLMLGSLVLSTHPLSSASVGGSNLADNGLRIFPSRSASFSIMSRAFRCCDIGR